MKLKSRKNRRYLIEGVSSNLYYKF